MINNAREISRVRSLARLLALVLPMVLFMLPAIETSASAATVTQQEDELQPPVWAQPAVPMPVAPQQGFIQVPAMTTSDPAEELKLVEPVLAQKIRSRIAELDRVCDLNEAQLKKLQIAGKGAVAKALETESQMREKMQGGMGGFFQFAIVEVDANAPNVFGMIQDDDAFEPANEIGEGVDDNEDVEINQLPIDDIPSDDNANDNASNDDEGEAIEVAEPAANIAPAGLLPPMNFRPAFGAQLVSGVRPEESEVFTIAVAKTLTEDQLKTLEEHQEAKKKFQRDASVRIFIFRVDRELLLSADQREKLTVLIDEHFGDRLRQQYVQPPNQQFPLPVSPDAETLEKFRADALAVLDENQVEAWEQQFEPQLTATFRMMPAMPVQGFANIAPMIAPQPDAMVPVLVAADNLAAHTPLTDENVKLENWPAGVVPGNVATSMDQIIGMEIKSRWSKGLPIMLGDMQAVESDDDQDDAPNPAAPDDK